MGTDLTDLRVFQTAEVLSQMVWNIVVRWDNFAKATVGEQLMRSVDSIGANIAESHGRYHYGDKLRFLYFARGSLYETRFWLRQAYNRRLLSSDEVGALQEQVDVLPISLNNFISSLKRQRSNSSLKEEPNLYETPTTISQSRNLSISPNESINPF